jgi:1,2-diacylglycerol-3-alpha-glucose alpha-1,2-galactosyltransferase
MSSADKVKGQGVGSAYIEQVNLVKEGLRDKFLIHINKKFSSIMHYHTIDLKHYIMAKLSKNQTSLGYVHFLPETLKGSIKLPKPAQVIFEKYVIEFYKSMDHLVTVNPYFIELLKKYDIPEDKISYIPNYVSKESFYPMKHEDVKSIRSSYGIDADAFVVLGVGQVQTRKGVLDFVEIAKNNPSITFVWAGGFSFGGITDGYKELKAVMENPPTNVKFIGIVDRDDMNSIYNMSDVLFMPSYSELFPMSILESMSVGKPILLRSLDIYEVILDGYYAAGSDNDEFSMIINNMATDIEYYNNFKRMSEKGSQFYSKENVLKMWDDLYSTLSTKRHSND